MDTKRICIVLMAFAAISGLAVCCTARSNGAKPWRAGEYSNHFLCDGQQDEAGYLYAERGTRVVSEGRQLAGEGAYVIYRIPVAPGHPVRKVGYRMNYTPFAFEVSLDGASWTEVCAANPEPGGGEPDNFELEGNSILPESIASEIASKSEVFFRFRSTRFDTGALSVISYLAYDYGGQSEPPAPPEAPADLDALYSPTQLKEDFTFLLETIQNVHPDVFAHLSSGDFRANAAEVESRLNRNMTALEFYAVAAPFVASLGDAHTSLFSRQQIMALLASEPIPPFGARDDIYVTREAIIVTKPAGAPGSLPEGTKILAIRGKSIAEINREIGQCFAAENPNRPYVAPSDFFIPLYGAVLGFSGQYELTVQEPGLPPATRTVDGVVLKELKARGTAAPGAHDAPFKKAYFSRLRTMLLTIDSFSNDAAFSEFIGEAFDEVAGQDVKHIIIDLRHNPGGKSELGDLLFARLYSGSFRQFSNATVKVSNAFLEQRGAAGLPVIGGKTPDVGETVQFELEEQDHTRNGDTFTGSVYVLIGPDTASSATSFATMVKDYGRGTLLGEESGGLASSFGDSLEFRLPHTGLSLAVSCKFFCRPSGDRSAIRLIPDPIVVPEIPDLQTGRDTVLQFALDLISQAEARE